MSSFIATTGVEGDHLALMNGEMETTLSIGRDAFPRWISDAPFAFGKSTVRLARLALWNSPSSWSLVWHELHDHDVIAPCHLLACLLDLFHG
jgi:hypothetical protein